MTDLAQQLAGWPLAATLAMTVTAQALRAGRRRSALNEAMHELRRPLQTVALSVSGPRVATPTGVESSMRLAAVALARLDREINGGVVSVARRRIETQALVGDAVGRWRARAVMSDGSLELRWRAGRTFVIGDPAGLSQALDNLIVNAIEHGGPAIVVEARRRGDRLRVSVADSGRAARPESRRDNPAEVIARLTGRRRHGHGLAVVRGVAAAHDGRFVLRHSEQGSLAVLELPLATGGAERAA